MRVAHIKQWCSMFLWAAVLTFTGAANAESGLPCGDLKPIEVFAGSSCTSAQYLVFELVPDELEPVGVWDGCGTRSLLELQYDNLEAGVTTRLLVGTEDVHDVFGVEPDIVVPTLGLHPNGGIVNTCAASLTWMAGAWVDGAALQADSAGAGHFVTPAPVNSRGEQGQAPICGAQDGGDSGAWPPALSCPPEPEPVPPADEPDAEAPPVLGTPDATAPSSLRDADTPNVAPSPQDEPDQAPAIGSSSSVDAGSSGGPKLVAARSSGGDDGSCSIRSGGASHAQWWIVGVGLALGLRQRRRHR
jgi:hypothetical protein